MGCWNRNATDIHYRTLATSVCACTPAHLRHICDAYLVIKTTAFNGHSVLGVSEQVYYRYIPDPLSSSECRARPLQTSPMLSSTIARNAFKELSPFSISSSHSALSKSNDPKDYQLTYSILSSAYLYMA